MICLFCKENSTNSKSVEHIIPESLGNKYTTLDEVHILRMFINMTESDEELYRKKFKILK